MGNMCTSMKRCRRGNMNEDLPARQVVVGVERRPQNCVHMLPPQDPAHSAPEPASSTSFSTSTPIVHSLPNFPLPRELRDLIYAQLLDGREVEDQAYNPQPNSLAVSGPIQSTDCDIFNRSCSTAHTYRFHTNILAVNKEIHAEAMVVLHSSNTFIAISHGWPDLDVLKHRYDVPIVTEDAGRIRRSMVVSLNYSIRHPSYYGRDGLFLMLLRDFKLLVRMLQWLYFQTKVGMTLTRRRDADHTLADHTYAGEFSDSPKVQLAPTLRPYQTQRKLEAATFAVARAQLGLVLPGQKFTLGGLSAWAPQEPSDRFAEYIGSYCGNRSVRIEAMLWKMVETAQSLKRSADALLERGQHPAAAARYEWIFDACQSWDFSKFLPAVIDNRVSHSAARVLYQIVHDSVATASMLYFHLNKPDTGTRLAASVGLVITLLHNIPIDPLVWPAAIDSYLLKHPSQDVLTTGLILTKQPDLLRLASLAMMAFQLLRTESDHAQADLAFVKSILANEEELQRYENSMTEGEILSRLSVTARPVKVFNSAIPEAVVHQKPTKLKGWWILDDEPGADR